MTVNFLLFFTYRLVLIRHRHCFVAVVDRQRTGDGASGRVVFLRIHEGAQLLSTPPMRLVTWLLLPMMIPPSTFPPTATPPAPAAITPWPCAIAPEPILVAIYVTPVGKPFFSSKSRNDFTCCNSSSSWPEI